MSEIPRLPQSQADLDIIESRLGDLRKAAKSAMGKERADLEQTILWIELMLPAYKSLVRLLQTAGTDRRP